MGPEAKFYQQIKRNLKEFSFIRIENSSLLGTPDLLVYNTSGHFCTVELKVTKSKKIIEELSSKLVEQVRRIAELQYDNNTYKKEIEKLLAEKKK